MMQFNRQRLIALGVVILGGVLLWVVIIQLSRIGKVAVTVETSPENTSVTIDGHSANSGVNYISSGTHIFKATKDGYSPAEQKVKITDNNNYVALLPEPVSEAAISEANSDKESSRAQTISGIASGRSGEALIKSNPIVNKLPYSDVSGPYKIDYGYNQDDNDRLYLIVSYTSPNGRTKAIKWLQHNHVDITTTEIVFADFVNPAAANEEHHD